MNNRGFAFTNEAIHFSRNDVLPAVIKYRYPITAIAPAPIASTIRSHMVSTRPLFCMFISNVASIPNSKISHNAPHPTENMNANNATNSGDKSEHENRLQEQSDASMERLS